MDSGGQENKKGLGGMVAALPSGVFRGFTKCDATCLVQILIHDQILNICTFIILYTVASIIALLLGFMVEEERGGEVGNMYGKLLGLWFGFLFSFIFNTVLNETFGSHKAV